MGIGKSRVLFIAYLLIGVSSFVHSQSITLSGYIYDGETGERLIGAAVRESGSANGTVSNNYGFYSLQISQSKKTIISVFHLGYSQSDNEITALEDTKLNISVFPNPLELKEVEVIQSKEVPIEKRIEMGVISIPTAQIEALPALGGEVDVLKAFQLMPGVQSGNEGSSGLYVRGGSPDQNLILLDDVPMYYVNHLGGFVSTFNIDAISNVKLIKGGFPAHQGGRLSSILDIRMKDGNMKEFKGSGMIGMLATKLAVQGPIKEDTTSYMVSARRMLYDLLTRPITKLAFGGVSLGYTFYDFNGKVNHIFSERDRIFLSGYIGKDKSIIRKNGEESFKNSLGWGNELAAFRWNHIYGHKMFGNVTASYTRYRFFTENSGEFTRNNESFESSQDFSSGIHDFGLKTDFEYFASPIYKLKFGTNSIYHTFKPGVTTTLQRSNGQSTFEDVAGNQAVFAWENSAYLENELKIGTRVNTNIGLRAAVYHVDGEDYFSPEPRILASYLLSDDISIKGSYSKMQQNVHLLTSSGIGIPRDLWVPVTEKVAPQKSDQWSLGMVKSIYKNTYEVSLEGYFKTLDNLIEYKEGASFLTAAPNWEELVEIDGKGESYGAELLVQKKQGRTTGWVGYTWSKTNRQFDNINNGKKFPYRYDRRHDASVVVSHKFNEKIDLAGTWVYSTGSTFTLPVGRYDIINEFDEPFDDGDFKTSEIFTYGERNGNRLRSYHRMDVGVNFRKKKKWGERTLNLSIYNLYARRNPYYYFIDKDIGFDNDGNRTGDGGNSLYQQSLFPLIPSISYGFRF